MDEIRIDQLEVYAYHGVYPEENKIGQTFYVNLVLYVDARRAGLSDELSLSVDYGTVCQFVHNWMRVHTCKLIEAAAEKMTQDLLLNFPLINAIDAEICKPEAPIRLPFHNVSVKIHRGWHKVYLSVGSNMGDRNAYIEGALLALNNSADIRKVRCSSLLETEPYGGVEQAPFLNGAIELETLYTPEELLLFLHQIEADAGRERLIHWGPRTLDLDILFYDKDVYEQSDLIIPHVDMQNRYFVLKPLSELAPHLRHPVLGKTISELLAMVVKENENDGE